jgi:hypothetical protein
MTLSAKLGTNLVFTSRKAPPISTGVGSANVKISRRLINIRRFGGLVMTRDEIAELMNKTSGNSWGTEEHFQRFAMEIMKRLKEELSATKKSCT